MWHHMVSEAEDIDEAQAQQTVLAADDHVPQRAHHQQQIHQLTMSSGVYCLQSCVLMS